VSETGPSRGTHSPPEGSSSAVSDTSTVTSSPIVGNPPIVEAGLPCGPRDMSGAQEPNDIQTKEPALRMPAPLATPVDRDTTSPFQEPLEHVDVFVDDFIGLVQGSKRRRRNLRRTLLHAIDDVFATPLPHETNRKEPTSVKKLLKGDGSWATQKIILGWVIDMVKKTVELTPHRKEQLQLLFDELR